MTAGEQSNGVVERRFEWSSEQPGNSLGSNQLHLWFADVQELSESGVFGLLTDSELDRSSRILDQHKRHLYLGGRAGLRLLLSGYTSLHNNALEFGYGDRGKPGIVNKLDAGDLNFNYTVSSQYALYGFAWNRELGVDLEVIPRRINAEAMARRILTKAEHENWLVVPESKKNNAMLACWTRKEAYGKALGVGIRYTMDQVPLFVNPGNDNWATEIKGLFEGEHRFGFTELEGVQLGLPVPGVASVMFDAGHGSENINPVLSAYQLKIRNKET